MAKTLEELEEQRVALNDRIEKLSESEGWTDRVDALQTQYDILMMDIGELEKNPDAAGGGEMLALRGHCVEGARNLTKLR